MNKAALAVPYIAFTFALSGCSVLLPGSVNDDKVNVKEAAIKTERNVTTKTLPETNAETKENGTEKSAEGLVERSQRFEKLKTMQLQRVGETETTSLSQRFSENDEITVSARELSLSEFIHYIFGDLLKTNYVVGELAQKSEEAVTMSLANEVTERKLFEVARDTLSDKGFQVSLKDDIFYITSLDDSSAQNLIIGIGNTPDSVPNTDQKVLQIISLDYGYRNEMGMVAKTLANVSVRNDPSQGVLFVEGRREEILKALEFFNLVDNPSPLARHVAAVELVFLSPDEFTSQLREVMTNEGIMVETRANASASVVLTPIETSGQVIVFARSEEFLTRVQYWAGRLDVPTGSNQKQYFVYQPNYARAADLGNSLSPLLGGSRTGRSQDNNYNRSSSQSRESSAGSSANEMRSSGSQSAVVNTDELDMIVDERTNSLVFKTTGETYHSLLPLIKRLDTQPKQVMLEVIIAEVTLNDSFEKGVDFTLQDGNGVATTAGGFGLDGMGGFSYTLTGLDGDIRFKLFRDSSLVNILSRPSIVVRDGIAASISVGTDIPVIGQTTSDPIAGERQTTQIEYRKTGIELTVTPTVNSQGVVIMTIDQSISNTVDGGVSVQGSPSIFERTLSTEVVADSGQTVVLGGLISENTTNSEATVPGLGRIPVIGHLFRSDSESTDKTELVVLVTPRIIERSDQWDSLKEQFKSQFERLNLQE